MIIGVAGKAGAGKDLFCEIAVEEFDAVHHAFADAVKEEVGEFLTKNGIFFEPRNLWGTQADKEEVLVIPRLTEEHLADKDLIMMFVLAIRTNHYKNRPVSYFGYRPPIARPKNYLTFRALLQWWGTEFRRAEDPDYWVKRCMAKCDDPHQLYVISDVRFENEAKGIIYSGGELIKVIRPHGINISGMGHASETSLDNWEEWDFILTNDGTKEEYEELCRRCLKEILDGNI